MSILRNFSLYRIFNRKVKSILASQFSEFQDESVDILSAHEAELNESTETEKMNVVLTEEEWLAIAPVLKEQAGRLRWKLQSGWVDCFVQKL